jgi:hypothetical protein
MRVQLVFLILIAALVGAYRPASAEKAKAKEAAKIYSRAGEKGKVVLKVREGQVMRVDRKEGRWFKVRVSGRTGWIPQTKVQVMEEEEIARNTRRRPFVDGRGTKRGFGGESGPEDRVGADAVDPDTGGGKEEKDDPEEADDPPKKKTPKKEVVIKDDDEETGDTSGEEPESDEEEGGEVVDDRPKVRVASAAKIYSEADEDSDEAEWKVKPDTLLFPTGKKGKFTEVENAEGDIGFILTSKVEAVEIDEVSDGEGGGKRSSQIDVRGRLGVTIIQQGLRSDGPQMLPDNYNLSTSAATIALGGAYLRPYKKKFVVGGEANLDVAKALPGIKAPGNQTTGITLYHLNARAMFGYDMKRKSGMMVFGRLGLRWQSYQVSNATDLDKNTAKLPSEILTAPSLGAALAIPRLTNKVGLRFSLDAVVAGASLKQTKRLEDGNQAKMKGAIVGAGFTYRWKPSMDINATYDLNFSKYNFGTPLAGSMRGHMGTGAVTRTDLFHGVTVGVAKAF